MTTTTAPAPSSPPSPKVYERIARTSQCGIGADPELFIETDDGSVVGSERVIPTDGLKAYGSKVVRDGIQVELHPTPSTCRAFVGNYIKNCMNILKAEIDKNKGMHISFKPVVRVSKEELERLSAESQKLGCKPSFNLYDKEATVDIVKVGAVRSAAGHIHMSVRMDPERAIPMLDLFAGNTFVLFDRDPAQAERRKFYGRAGEYRLPEHGFEYRTLSNCWLRAYPLFSFAAAMCRVAHRIAGGYNPQNYLTSNSVPSLTINGNEEAFQWLKVRIEPKRLAAAINLNDAELAAENFETVREFVKVFVPEPLQNPRESDNATWPLYPTSLPWFDHFVAKGLDYWFNKDPLHNWTSMVEGHGCGWENFLGNIVKADFQTSNFKKVNEAARNTNSI